MYGVFHRRRLLWGLVIALCCLFIPLLGGIAAREHAARMARTQPVGTTSTHTEIL